MSTNKIIENYLLQEVIGSGSYGKVFKSIDQKEGGVFAVKVIKQQKFLKIPKLLEFTNNEISTLKKLNNPNIITFIKMLQSSNNVYLIYEFCNGGTLEDIIKQKNFLTEKEALAIFSQILNAFRSLFKDNILHRDLKPSNILIHNGIVKVADFGFCKTLLSPQDLTQTMVGSPIYMAPEILKGYNYNIKADIWSMGVVLFELLFGFCPYEDKTIISLIGKIDNKPLVLPKHINQISPQVEDLLHKMLAVNPSKRIDYHFLLSLSLFEKSAILYPQIDEKNDIQKAGSDYKQRNDQCPLINYNQSSQQSSSSSHRSPYQYPENNHKNILQNYLNNANQNNNTFLEYQQFPTDHKAMNINESLLNKSSNSHQNLTEQQILKQQSQQQSQQFAQKSTPNIYTQNIKTQYFNNKNPNLNVKNNDLNYGDISMKNDQNHLQSKAKNIINLRNRILYEVKVLNAVLESNKGELAPIVSLLLMKIVRIQTEYLKKEIQMKSSNSSENSKLLEIFKIISREIDCIQACLDCFKQEIQKFISFNSNFLNNMSFKKEIHHSTIDFNFFKSTIIQYVLNFHQDLNISTSKINLNENNSSERDMNKKKLFLHLNEILNCFLAEEYLDNELDYKNNDQSCPEKLCDISFLKQNINNKLEIAKFKQKPNNKANIFS